MSSPFPGPIAPESNPPINPQYYNPSRYIISAISLGATTTVTTTQDMNFVIGQLVRFIIPQNCGTVQLNAQTGYIISFPASNQAEIDINSANYDAFSASSTYVQPQIIPVGDINTGTINTMGRSNTGTYVPGAFIDVSPA